MPLREGRPFTDVWDRRVSSSLGTEADELCFGCAQFEELRHVDIHVKMLRRHHIYVSPG